ncbi:hypothetical protein HPG69_018589 [Diceros bicornis minor]|uniref:Uncharacterized protein n=1 Tax=Diceros bicornis minor TaxID=77932 RepID=A0A7J7EZH6_DICBM|nr:hypothetical protein HPG69_018589 [Diceros bicornis minor]
MRAPPPWFRPQNMKEQVKLFSPEIKQIDPEENYTFRNHIMFWAPWAWSECPWCPGLSSPLPALRCSLKRMGWPLPGPVTQHEQPRPWPNQAVPEAWKRQHEGTPQLQITLWGPGDSGSGLPAPAEDSSRDWLQPCREAAGSWPPDISFEPGHRVPFPLTLAWATPKGHTTGPALKPTGTPVTGPAQPAEDGAIGSRAPLQPCGTCSPCPSWGSDWHGQDGARAALAKLP